jgi:hypothetical protein
MQPCRSCRERAWLCVLRRARVNFNARSAFVAERERDTLDERQPDRRAAGSSRPPASARRLLARVGSASAKTATSRQSSRPTSSSGTSATSAPGRRSGSRAANTHRRGSHASTTCPTSATASLKLGGSGGSGGPFDSRMAVVIHRLRESPAWFRSDQSVNFGLTTKAVASELVHLVQIGPVVAFPEQA